MSRIGGPRWWIPGCRLALQVLATVFLVWLAYRFVPLHLSFAEGMGMEIPLAVRLADVASRALVRAFPFLVLAAPPAATVAVIVVYERARRPSWTLASVV